MMDAGLRTGAVGALRGYLHPVSVAREVMRRLPHELLVGEGAHIARWCAHEIAAPTAENLVEDSRRVWQAWFERTLTPAQKQAWPDIPLAELCRYAIDPETGRDTTVFLALDAGNNICSGTNSGWGWKYPGRLGDSPIIGAGSYADARYGAAACTGAGEMTSCSLLCPPARSFFTETCRHGRRCRAGSGGGYACPENRPDQPRHHPCHRSQRQPQSRCGERHRWEFLLAMGRIGQARATTGRGNSVR